MPQKATCQYIKLYQAGGELTLLNDPTPRPAANKPIGLKVCRTYVKIKRVRLELENITILGKIGKTLRLALERLPGERYGKQVSRTELELSPFWIPRDMQKLLGIDDYNQGLRVKFSKSCTMPWDFTPQRKWVSLSLQDAIEALCGEGDPPEYIDGIDTRYSSGVRIVHLEAGFLAGSIRFNESKMPYSKMDILLRA